MLNTVLHHVVMSWIIETNQQLEYDIDKHNPDCITDGPWYNRYICTKLHGTVLEIYIRNSITNRYNILCYIDAHDKQQPSSVGFGIIGGCNALPENSTKEAFFKLGATIDFIDYCLKCFDHNYLSHSNM